MIDDYLYYYRAIVTRVIDGDTVVCDIDQGMHDWKHDQRIRMLGINTPEIRGEEKEKGIQAANFLKSQLGIIYEGPDTVPDSGSLRIENHHPRIPIILQTHKDKTGKYGRWLGTLWIDFDLLNLGTDPDGWINVNEEMVGSGHAVRTR